ncbi:MAG TPA: bifunctional 2',3'-cyclic-nucleotide 2'-phosphodiesterase/3'-nucleotidase [Alphaproteobacteria bacterium]|nr:bifunctional 2',3'-cyclic-nucleotide 2'-phosphodiesterase/3'-nucleotidase [Alphaproteobacteria bacterium]
MTARLSRTAGPAALILAAVLPAAMPASAAEVKLRLMETTDIHNHLFDYDYYRDGPDDTVGLAKTATLIRAAREEVPNTVLIDNGDLIQGNPMGDYMATVKGLDDGDIHPVYKAMNLLDYAVGNLGNHEFNYGIGYLERAIAGAEFPYVSANVFVDDGDGDPSNDEHFVEPYLILDRMVVDAEGAEHALKVGVIGFVPPQIMTWDRTHLQGRLATRDIVEVAEALVPRMREEGADIVVAVPHSGFAAVGRQGMDENAVYYLSEVDGIDAILFGHAHAVFPSPDFTDGDVPGVDLEAATINGVPSVMPGFWGSHLGIIDLTLMGGEGNWTVTGAEVEARPIYERRDREVVALVDAQADILDAVRQEHEETLAFVRSPVGETSAPINSYFALIQDDPSIQIVTDAQKWYVERLVEGSEYDGIPVLSAGAPFKAGGRGGPDYFTDVPAGEIAIKNAADLYLYPNTVRAVLLTGAQVKDWLEMSANMFNTIDPGAGGEQALINPGFPSYNFDVIDGVTYRIDVTQPPKFATDGSLANPDSGRIVDLRYDGRPIDPDAQFIVATNNYRAGGGGHFPHLDGSNVIIEAPDENRTVLINYIMAQGTIDPSADGNWSLAPIGGDVQVTFQTGPGAAAYLEDRDDVELLGTTEEGFARYALTLAE